MASPLFRLFRYARPHRGKIAWAMFCSFTNKICDIAPEVLIGVAVDVVVRGEKSYLGQMGFTAAFDQMALLGILTFLIWGGESLFEYLYETAWRNLAQTIQHELRLDAYAHAQTLDMAYFEDRSTGTLTSIMNDDVNQLERFLDRGANQIIQVTTAFLGVGAIFFALQPTIALLSLIPVPIIIAGSFYFQTKAEPLYADVRERAGAIAGRLAGNLAGIAVIKSYTAEALEVKKLAEESDGYRAANGRAIRISSAFIPLIRMAILAGFLVTLVYGGYLTLSGQLAVGAYSVMVFLTQRLLWPMTELAQVFDLYQRAMASTRRVLDLLDTPASEKTAGQAFDRAACKGAIHFDNVSFAYAGRERVVTEVSATIPAGTTAAFIGTTGSGKSTLAKLLMRFYHPSHGRIMLDGQDIAGLSVSDLRSSIGFVSQDVFLFDGTIAENIAYGRPGAAAEDVERAAKLAEAHEFITGLPDGYGTAVGERGQKLSGGQRQRISLARAILKDAPILILDEATSAVDNDTEAAIQRSLETVGVGRTVLVIAHRLTTIRNADQVFTIESGRITSVMSRAEWAAQADAQV
ncbi:ABC transporter ATP-binding protein [Lacibacterium aquatile]|uniref:ABC transporter ATP-binding protein n=1 Tax=Lacibacterium aquatile TaxID=1168082 RepID=A0ABW5DRL6_9PROT